MNNFTITHIDHHTGDGYRLNAKGISYCVWKDENSAMYLFVQDMEQRLAAAEAKLPRWIPVSERLPEHNQLIAMLTEHEKLCGEFYLDRFVVRDFTGVCFDASCVTHWMPLPEPPNNGENAG